MYSRTFLKNDEMLPVPEGYGGTALTGDVHTENEEAEEEVKEVSASPREGGIFSRILPYLGGFFKKDGGCSPLGDFRIGREEILIIATAAFLFFSEDGDRECAILLLILLFIN